MLLKRVFELVQGRLAVCNQTIGTNFHITTVHSAHKAVRVGIWQRVVNKNWYGFVESVYALVKHVKRFAWWQITNGIVQCLVVMSVNAQATVG